MERQVDKISRQVYFMYAPAMNYTNTTGINNTWIYDRAPDGYKFILQKAIVSTTLEATLNRGIIGIYDGHEYTHWNIYPGVESKEILNRAELSANIHNADLDLYGWECKEFTLGIRSSTETFGVKMCIIIVYYLRKMSWLEKLQYAVMQPRGQRYRKSGPSTVERSESVIA